MEKEFFYSGNAYNLLISFKSESPARGLQVNSGGSFKYINPECTGTFRNMESLIPNSGKMPVPNVVLLTT